MLLHIVVIKLTNYKLTLAYNVNFKVTFHNVIVRNIKKVKKIQILVTDYLKANQL